jgi:hypothetical protein
MSEPEALKQYSFTEKRPLTRRELSKFAQVAAQFDLQPGFEYQDELAMSTKELLDEHVDATFPTSRQSYVGKEHFWQLSDELEQARVRGTWLLTALCLPVKNYDGFMPHEMGIKVLPRKRAGMPYPPAKAILRSKNGVEHELLQTEGFKDIVHPDLLDFVVEVGSVLDLSEDTARQSEFLTRKISDDLVVYAGRLSQWTNHQLTFEV